MNEYLVKKISAAQPASVYATVVKDGLIELKRIGSHEDVRFWYNQMACLIGATAMRTLQAAYSAPFHSKGAMPGLWTDRFASNVIIESPETLVDAACQAPSDFTDAIGYLAWHDDWPHGTLTISGMKNMSKSMCELGNIVYGYDFKASVGVGGSAETSAVKRVTGSLKDLNRRGITAYKQDELCAFLDLLLTARFLHIFHQVSVG